MKLLIFIDWFTPGYKAGGPVRSNVNIVDNLKDNIDIFIITSDTEYCEKLPYEGIKSNYWVKNNGAFICYIKKQVNILSRIKQLISKIKQIGNCVWYINGIYSPFFSILPLILSHIFNPKKVIISPRGMLSPQAFKAKKNRKIIIINILKFCGFYKHVLFHTTSKIETNHIQELLGEQTPICQIDNLPMRQKKLFTQKQKSNKSVKLISVARISPEKNTLFALQCLALCKENIDFQIYGQIYDKIYWKECQKAITELPTNITVEYMGVIPPKDLPEKLAKYDFFFLPTQGENFGNAILESLQMGVPVIISDKTPWRNLQQYKAGWDLPLDSIEAFSKVIDKTAVMSDEEYQQYVNGSQTIIQEMLNFPKLINDYIEMFSSNGL